MRAGVYQRSDPENCCIWGPGEPSITSWGFGWLWTAKKKSGPWPAQAVPSFRSLASKVEGMASRKLGLADFASSMSSVAVSLSAAGAGDVSDKPTTAAVAITRRFSSRIGMGTGRSWEGTDEHTGTVNLQVHQPGMQRGSRYSP